MTQFIMPVGEGELKQMEAAGLLADIPYKVTANEKDNVTLEFEGGEDAYRLAQRLLTRAQSGYLYDPDRIPNNGDEFYVPEYQISNCAVRDNRIFGFTSHQFDQLQKLGLFDSLVVIQNATAILQERLRETPRATRSVIWDKDQVPDKNRDFATLPVSEYQKLKPILAAFKSPSAQRKKEPARKADKPAEAQTSVTSDGTFPVTLPGTLKQIQASGLLPTLPFEPATDPKEEEVEITFATASGDFRKFADKFRAAKPAFLYNADSNPRSGNQVYLTAEKRDKVAGAIRKRNMTTIDGKRGVDLTDSMPVGQIDSMEKIVQSWRLSDAENQTPDSRHLALARRVLDPTIGLPIYFWDADDKPDTMDDFYWLHETHYTKRLSKIEKALKSLPAVVIPEYYKNLKLVSHDEGSEHLYRYGAVLISDENGEAIFLEDIVNDRSKPPGSPRVLTYNDVQLRTYTIPPGYRSPQNAEEFEKIVADHPEFFPAGNMGLEALPESQFRMSLSDDGSYFPLVAISAINPCTAEQQATSYPIDNIPLTDDEAIQLARWLQLKPVDGKEDMSCVDAGEESAGELGEKRFYRLNLDRHKVQGAIARLDKILSESRTDDIPLTGWMYPGVYDPVIPFYLPPEQNNPYLSVSLTGSLSLSRSQVEKLREALVNLSNGDRGEGFVEWCNKYGSVFGALGVLTSPLWILAIVLGPHLLASSDWANRRASIGKAKQAKFDREIATAEPRNWFEELGAEDMTKAARKGKYRYIVANPDVLPEMIATFSRTERNNYFSVRPTGSGKTSDYEALANAIAGDKAEKLNGRKLISVKLSSLVAFGGGVQGGFEAAVLGVLEQAHRENAILFWDEAALIKYIGTHSGRSRGMDMELLQALNKGLAPSGFATTDVEFEKDFPLGVADPLVGRCVLNRQPPPSGDFLADVLAMQIVRHREQNDVEINAAVLSTVEKRAGEVFHGIYQPRRSVALLDAAVDFILIQRRRQKSGQLGAEEKVYTEVNDELVDDIIKKKKGEKRDQKVAVVRDAINGELVKAAEMDFDLAPERELLELGAKAGEEPHEFTYRMSHLLKRLKIFNALLYAAELDPVKMAEALMDMRNFVAAGGFVAELDRPDADENGNIGGPKGPNGGPKKPEGSGSAQPLNLAMEDIRSLLPKFDEPFADPAAAEAAILAGASEAEIRLWRGLFPGELKPGSAWDVAEQMRQVHDQVDLTLILSRALLNIETREVSGPAIAAALFRASTSSVRDAESLARDGEEARRVSERYLALLEKKVARAEPLTRREERRLRVRREEQARRERGEAHARGTK